MERTKVDRRSADLAAELLDDGWSVVIFPEGGRSPDGWTSTFRGGAAYLALRCGRPVVPVHLEGTRKVWKRGEKLPTPIDRKSAVRVTFGVAHVAGEGADGKDESSRRFAGRIEAAVAALADEQRTDWWQARKRAAAKATPSLKGPEAGAWRRAWALEGQGRRPVTREWPYARDGAGAPAGEGGAAGVRGQRGARHPGEPGRTSAAATGTSTRRTPTSSSPSAATGS